MEVFTNEFTYTLKKNTIYAYSITRQGYDDGYSHTGVDSQNATSDAKGVLTITLGNSEQPEYDGEYALEVFEFDPDTTELTLVLLDTITKTRQYASTDTILAYMQGKVNPTQAVEYERLARHMINAVVGFPFTFKRKLLDADGTNTDSLIFNERLNRVFAVYENGQTIWEKDNLDYNDTYYRAGGSPYVMVFDQYSDTSYSGLDEVNSVGHHPTWPTRYSIPSFKYEYDYRVDAEWGWKVVPQDIQDATLLLINDIACGNNRYTNKYIRQWNGGGVAMSFADQVFAGTGNLIVDNILEKYKMEAIRARML